MNVTFDLNLNIFLLLLFSYVWTGGEKIDQSLSNLNELLYLIDLLFTQTS